MFEVSKRMSLPGVMIAAAAAVLTASAPAEASTLTCSVNGVAWATGGSGTLQIFCNGVGHFAFGSHTDTDCTSVNLEARKSWQNLAQAALLSGKTLTVEFTPSGTGAGQCSGGPSIFYVKLNGT
jgi:hypothetical protein